MNLMGKIFTLFIFFLSISFLVLAIMVGASHRNWKEVATTNKAKASLAQNRLDAAKTASKDTEKILNNERVSRQLQLSQLFSRIQIAQSRLDEAAADTRVLNERNAQLAAELKVSNQRLVAQDAEVEDLKQRNNTLVNDIAAQVDSVVNLTTETYRLRGELDLLEKSAESLNGQLARQHRVLKAHGLDQNSLTDQIPTEVEGLVVNKSNNFISVSVGTDDGVKEGHPIDIYRNDRYIGRAEITRAGYNVSAARLLPEYQQTVVKKGDYVTTKL